MLPTHIYSLSLHDALPIYQHLTVKPVFLLPILMLHKHSAGSLENLLYMEHRTRSEEHTSELQSPCNLVCRLLLEKKKNTKKNINIITYIKLKYNIKV